MSDADAERLAGTGVPDRGGIPKREDDDSGRAAPRLAEEAAVVVVDWTCCSSHTVLGSALEVM